MESDASGSAESWKKVEEVDGEMVGAFPVLILDNWVARTGIPQEAPQALFGVK
jgi:hypothetical protein